MAESKAVTVTEKPVMVPKAVAKLPALKKQKVTARQLASYERDIALAFAPQVLPMAFAALFDRVKRRDMRAIEKTLQIYNILHDGSNGVNITNNIVNTATAVAASQAARGFDSVIRELSQQEQPE
jgi:hypothetical protein